MGPGLIGGSLLLAIRKFLPEVEIRAWARRQSAVDEMLSTDRLVDLASSSVEEVVDGVDLAILAMPICAMAEVAEQFPETKGGRQIVTDVGSVKGSVVRDIDPTVRERGHLDC